MSINLNALRLFEAVAKHGNVTRAAESLNISQPAISKALRELEEHLGVVLLERGARGVRLTEAGAALAEHARALFGIARAAEEEMTAYRGVARGTLRIGASTTIATWLLPPIIAEFRRCHPAIDVRLVSANTADIARRLLAYELDVALVEGPVPPSRLVTTPWVDDDLVLVVPAGHKLARGKVSWSEVKKEVLLVREPGSGTREVMESGLKAGDHVPERTVEMGSTQAIVQAVAAGLGVAFVSRAAAADHIALGRIELVQVRGVHLSRTLMRVDVRGRKMGAAALAFVEML